MRPHGFPGGRGHVEVPDRMVMAEKGGHQHALVRGQAEVAKMIRRRLGTVFLMQRITSDMELADVMEGKGQPEQIGIPHGQSCGREPFKAEDRVVDDTVPRVRFILGIPDGESREGGLEIVPDRSGPEPRVIQGKRDRSLRKSGKVRRMVATAPGCWPGRVKRP